MAGQNKKKISAINMPADELRELDKAEKAARPGNEAYKISRKKKWIERLVLVVSGVIFAAAFPSWNWSLLGWVGIIPLFWIVRDKKWTQAWRAGYLWGFSWSVVSFFWIGEIESFNPPFSHMVDAVQTVIPAFNGGFLLPYIMGLVIGLFPAFWALPVPVILRGLLVPVDVQLRGADAVKEFNKPNYIREIICVLSLAAWWCILEWVRTWIATGLPWNFLATTQWRNVPLLQICEYTGSYGVSFLVAIVNISLAMAAVGWAKNYKHGRYRRPVPFIAAMILIMICVLTGSKSMLKYRKANNGSRFTAAILQGDIAQCRGATDKEAKAALNKYMRLSEIALISKPDIVIWPETAVPLPYRSSHAMCLDYRFRLNTLIQKHKIPFLIGTIDFEDIPPGVNKKAEIYNSALLIDKNGKIADKFHKINLVPFGEFVPLSGMFPFLVDAIGMGRQLTPGTDFSPIEIIPGVRAGIGICFEDIFPYVARNEVKKGANLLIYITNDAWYPTSSEPEQHLANSVFRAVENRRPMIRCGNNSGSCLILPNGVIADSIFVDESLDKNGKKKLLLAKRGEGCANFIVDVRPNPPMTFYTRHGDMFILLCWAIFAYASIIALWSWRKKKTALLEKFN